MVWEVRKIVEDGLEFLPDITQTPLWKFIDPDESLRRSKSDRQAAILYSAIRERDNYFQENTPTPFGNPKHEYLRGVVVGQLQAMEAWEEEENGQLVIRKVQGGKKLLVVDVLKRPDWYYESVRDNRKTLAELGFSSPLGG